MTRTSIGMPKTCRRRRCRLPLLALGCCQTLAAAAAGTTPHIRRTSSPSSLLFFSAPPPPTSARRLHAAAATTSDISSSTSTSSSSSSSSSCDWHAQWWPVAFERVTDRTKPYPFQLLNIPIVLWHDGSTQTWSTVEDKCPHRLAPLSEGRIENNCLECPYHGWSFDSQGTCTRIPQLEEGDAAPQTRTAAAVAAFPTTVAQGIIWVWGQSVQSLLATGQPLPDANLVPLCPPLLEEDVVCLDVSRDLPYSYETLLENILDPSHVPYTHHNTIGRRSYATPVPLKMTEEVSKVGYKGTWERTTATSPMMKKWMGQVKRETVFTAPSYMHHLIATPELSTWTVTYATPLAPGKSRILARFPFKFNETASSSTSSSPSLGSRIRRMLFKRVPDWLQHFQQNRVLDDDNIFLAVQERRLVMREGDTTASWNKNYYLPTKADLFIAQFRKWVSQYGGGGPFGPLTKHDLSEIDWRTPELLLNRYDQHVRHCSSCSRALSVVQKWKPRVVGLGLFAATLGKSCLDLVLPSPQASLGVPAFVAVALAFVWKLLCGLEEGLMRGPYPPPRNVEDKKGSKK